MRSSDNLANATETSETPLDDDAEARDAGTVEHGPSTNANTHGRMHALNYTRWHTGAHTHPHEHPTEEAPEPSDDLEEVPETDVEVEDISVEEGPAPTLSDGASPDVVAAAKRKFKQAKAELVLRFSDSQTNHVTFNVWDCGGQPVFDAMHSVFMSAATQNLSGNDGVNTSYTGALAVFAVVFSICDLASPSPKTQQRCLHFLFYWLNQIAVQAPGAPVMLIGTHKDAASDEDIALSHKLLRRHIKQLYMYKHLNIVKPEKAGRMTPWFFAVDNTAREMKDGHMVASDPAVNAIRAKLEEVVRSDERVVEGLDGKPTRYVDFRMPLQCLLLLETLKDRHGRVCSRTVCWLLTNRQITIDCP